MMIEIIQGVLMSSSVLHRQIDETIGWVSLQIDRLKAVSVQGSAL